MVAIVSRISHSITINPFPAVAAEMGEHDRQPVRLLIPPCSSSRACSGCMTYRQPTADRRTAASRGARRVCCPSWSRAGVSYRVRPWQFRPK